MHKPYLNWAWHGSNPSHVRLSFGHIFQWRVEFYGRLHSDSRRFIYSQFLDVKLGPQCENLPLCAGNRDHCCPLGWKSKYALTCFLVLFLFVFCILLYCCVAHVHTGQQSVVLLPVAAPPCWPLCSPPPSFLLVQKCTLLQVFFVFVFLSFIGQVTVCSVLVTH